MIVDCALYVQGRRHPGTCSLDELFGLLRAEPDPGVGTPEDRFVWIGLYEPTEDEFEAVTKIFDLPALAVEDAISAHQRPKLEVYDDCLFVVLKTARYVDTEEVVEFGEILCFVGRDFLVHVRHGEASGLGAVRRYLDCHPDVCVGGPGAVLHAILDRIVDDYAPVMVGIEHDVSEVEAQVFSPDGGANPTERIYKLKREVLEFHQAAVPLLEPLDRLARHRFALIEKDLDDYFRDVHDHLLRVHEQIIGFRDLLTSILEANLTQVSVRQNEDMRRISAWVAIAAVPTAVAGVYGMNFDHMPELGWQFGYPVVLGATALVCSLLYRGFRRNKWL